MSTSHQAPAIKFEYLNWVSTDPLSREQGQSQRLHEPTSRAATTDPMTGNVIKNVAGHPCLEDGNLTMYFETEQSRKAYVDLPVDHPNHHLPYASSDEDDRGG